MENVRPPGGRPELQFSYWALAQSLITTTALMALSIGAMRVIERYGKKTFTPFQKQGLGVLSTAVYFTATTYAFPLRKPVPPSTDLTAKPTSPPPQPREISYEQFTGMEESFYREVLDQLSRVDNISKQISFKDEAVILRILSQDKEAAVAFFQSQLPSPPPQSLEGRVEDLRRVDPHHEDGGVEELPRVDLQHRDEDLEELSRGEDVQEERGVEDLRLISLPRNPRDCSKIDLRVAFHLIETFRARVLQNGVRSIEEKIFWNGEFHTIHVDISTARKQGKALKQIDLVLGRLKSALLPPESRSLVVEEVDSRPLNESRIIQQEVDDVVVIELPSSPDPSMKVDPAPYVAGVHGPNGSLMRERLFVTLLNEYRRLLVEEMGLDPSCKQAELKAMWRKTEAQQKLLDVLTYLVVPGSEETSWWYYAGYTGHEGRYLLLMDAHRELIKDYTGKEGSYYGDATTYGRALSEAWMRPEIQVFQESLVSEHFIGESPRMTAENVHQALTLRNKAVGKADPMMKMSKGRSILAKLKGATSFCDYFGVNPPNLRKVESWSNGRTERQIYYLRHSTPNQGTYATTAPVDPIYRDFLKGAEGRGRGVLYAVHQRLGDFGCKFEQEGFRAQSIVDLEQDHPNLLVLFQSVENDLFMEKIHSVAYLRERLIGSFEILEGNKRNRLPARLMQGGNIDPTYKRDMEAIFDFVHQGFFDGKEVLSVNSIDCYGGLTEEKKMTWDSQTFIMLFYHFQREHLKHADLRQYGYTFDVAYVNTGCKDDFDRGFGQNMTSDRIHQTILHGKDIPHEDLEAMISSGQAPPIQTKGVPVIPYRLQPVLQVSRVLVALPEDKLRMLQVKTWNGFRLQSYDVRRHHEQSAIPAQ